MQKKGFDAASWNATYAGGGQLNRYPADGLVSLVFRLMAGRDRAAVNVLEVGCGAGNNAWFLAREGFCVTGVDGSPHCLDFARSRFAAENLRGDFVRKTFLELDQLDGPFDLIVDREALAHNQWDDLVRIMPKIAALLHPDGYFVSFFFASDHPDKRFMARMEQGATWFDPSAPVFGGAQWVTLPDETQLRQLFNPFRIVDLYKRTLTPYIRTNEPYVGDSEWIVVCGKKEEERS